MGFTFEPALPGDLDEIMRIEDESFAPEIREERSVFLDRLETFPEGNFVLVKDCEAGIPRALAGYFSSEVWIEVPPPDGAEWTLGHSARERHAPEGTVLYVSSFAVEPASRGNGTELFRRAVEQITAGRKSLKTIAFIVHENWAEARHIYEKAGFACSGRIDGFFPAPGGASAAALIMKKDI